MSSFLSGIIPNDIRRWYFGGFNYAKLIEKGWITFYTFYIHAFRITITPNRRLKPRLYQDPT